MAELGWQSSPAARLVTGQPLLRAFVTAGASSTASTGRAGTDTPLFCSAANRDWDFVHALKHDTKTVEDSLPRALQKTQVILL